MPYTTTWEKVGVLTKWYGHSTSAELANFMQEGQVHPNFDSIRYSIHDFTECESFLHEEDIVEYIAALDGAGAVTNPRIKIAMVAPSRDVLDAINVYKESMLSPYPIRTFATTAEARIWLES